MAAAVIPPVPQAAEAIPAIRPVILWVVHLMVDIVVAVGIMGGGEKVGDEFERFTIFAAIYLI